MKKKAAVVDTTHPHYDVIVIGGGAAGMMAAGTAAKNRKGKAARVLLLERNKRLGEKLRISGGGRCNILNAQADEKLLLANYGDAEKFLHSAFAIFGMKESYAFFESRGLLLKVERNNRAFPQSQKATDVVHALEAYMKESGVEVRSGIGVLRIHTAVRDDGTTGIENIVTSAGEFTADSYILATGGLSHPETGSTGDGFGWLRALGHTVKDPTPTIVPLRTEEKWTRALSGISVSDARITFVGQASDATGAKPKKFKRDGVILFTHFGISGPTVLNAAGAVADLLHEGGVTAHIDIFPTEDIGTLDKRITNVFDANKNKLLRNACREFMPHGVTDIMLAQMPGIDPDLEVHSVTKEMRKQLVHFVKDIPLTVNGLMGFERAVVADGGVPLTEVDTRTMRSLKISNLFLTGDLLHITRPSGGYSLQLCWTTGFVSGSNA